METKRGLKQPIKMDLSKPSHTWRFKTKPKQALALKELIELSGYPDSSTFFRNLVDERLMVESAFDILAEKWLAAGVELLRIPLGLNAVNRALRKHGYRLDRLEK